MRALQQIHPPAISFDILIVLMYRLLIVWTYSSEYYSYVEIIQCRLYHPLAATDYVFECYEYT